MFYIFIIYICKKVIVTILCFSWFYLQLSTTKIFGLMYNETLMNAVFPGFAVDLFLMSHDHFCTSTPGHTTWLSCHLGNQIPFSWIYFMTVWTCAVFWVVFWVVRFFFPLVISCGNFFFARNGCCICQSCFLWGLLQSSLNVAFFYCIQAILEKELCWFLQLKTKQWQCWCFSSGTELTANSSHFIHPWDQKSH